MNLEFRLPVSLASNYDPSEPQFLLRHKGEFSLQTLVFSSVFKFLLNCRYFNSEKFYIKIQDLGARVIRLGYSRRPGGESPAAPSAETGR